MTEKKTYPISVGPLHPYTEEPIMMKFEVDGERVTEVDVNPGYMHRGIEKVGTKKNPVQALYLAERICGICSVSHAFAFVRAVENATGIEPSERAKYIRTFVAELERIHSHLLWAGLTAHEMGFDSLLHLVWKRREEVLDMLEHFTGNRVNYAIMTVGGVRRDLEQEHVDHAKEMVSSYREVLKETEDVFFKDPSLKARTKDTGVLSRKEAIQLCALGPTARGSGVKRDVRQDNQYGAYDKLNVEAIVPEDPVGDVFDKIYVRLKEVRQSLNLIERTVDEMPEGKTKKFKPAVLLNKTKEASGKGIGRHEAPRGEVFHYVELEEGEETLVKWKVKPPTYNNLATWKPMLLGEQIADIPVVAAGIDPCIACLDRVAIIRQNERQVLTKEDLLEKSKQKTKEIRNA